MQGVHGDQPGKLGEGQLVKSLVLLPAKRFLLQAMNFLLEATKNHSRLSSPGRGWEVESDL